MGLTRYEYLVYEALVKQGSATARQLSEQSGVPLTAVYPQLHSLLDKGLIGGVEGEKKLFFAIKPSTGLQTYAQQRVDALSAAHKDYARELDKVFRTEKVGAGASLEAVYGIGPSQKLYLSMFRDAQQSLLIFGWSFGVHQKLSHYLRLLKKAHDRGVVVKLIVTDTAQEDWLRLYASAGVQIKYLDLPHFSLVVRDGEESKFTLKSPGLEQRFTIHVTEQAMAQSFADYFGLLWSKATPLH